ncbi:multidrug effflux MFS transporter [Kineococcus sp. SYSU DK004]|uniref:multidrug effflux MFS transporter n=1 Tax=Kineococcus sp. SYSU DK004 TaxID=3383125 RepID=UPI003D7D66F0
MSTPTVASLRARLPRPRPVPLAPLTAPGASAPGPAAERTVPLRVLLVVALLCSIGPLSIDMYLPAFPAISGDLSTSATAVQLTLTTFMAGMALGQLVLGPLSDRLGRRRLLLLGAATCFAAGVVCVLTPSIAVMVVARFVQGFSGAAGLVIGRAVVADVSSGRAAARAFSTLAVIQGVAPVVAPILGGVLAGPVGWRGIFGVIAAASLVMTLAVLLLLPETLPAERRHSGGAAQVAATARRVLSRRRYVGYVLTVTSAFAGIFAYVSAAPFVFTNVLGLSTGWFSVAFAANALGIVAGSSSSALLLRRLDPRTVLTAGVSLQITCAVAMGAAVFLLGSPTALVLPLLWLTMYAAGLTFGNATALAIEQVRFAAGTGSAVQGALQFGFAALVSPLVGLAGEASAVPMAVVMLGAAAVSATALFAVARPWSRRVPGPAAA